MHKSDFKSFYETYLDRVYRFVYFRVNQNRAMAEDLVSEVFMSALKHFESYDPTRSTSAWIMTIARNRLANHYRDTKQTVDVDEIGFLIPGEDGRATFETKETEMTVRKLLDCLEPAERRLIEMKYLLGYGYKDMSELLGRSAGALKVDTHRVMKKLRAEQQAAEAKRFDAMFEKRPAHS